MILRKVIKGVGLEPVQDLHNWHKWWSAKLDAAALMVGSVAVAYSQLPDDWRAALPPWSLTALAGVGLVIKSASLILRGAKQPSLEPKRPADE
ncbi:MULTISPECIES: hypothetical protein [Xanthomonas]|uniref:DUF7940 domain-containing protein n=1 Tax=Xanthomonas TaxID=338 RepID=UPI000536A6D8|nr:MULTISPECIES: hypothetical protein [Xanthomonas]KGU41848.1 hypothetical protein NY95_12150 [Xanthomonas citri pv. fuscans]MBO9766502.1 hypothetical protein [Xanthomonas phaseoli pv. dieffenbachiae]MBO9776153.1 hypothetical protein [Xanthomonas phaseoli pv. dieffenbachiae]MBO9778248.1 hypothetical protein [Xanthomonas phaseoli pv. dieffenbachiae]MBO9795363.1 hypothetical protein [Xanthomonas phaseoli pv. dieffenbachiae]